MLTVSYTSQRKLLSAGRTASCTNRLRHPNSKGRWGMSWVGHRPCRSPLTLQLCADLAFSLRKHLNSIVSLETWFAAGQDLTCLRQEAMNCWFSVLQLILCFFLYSSYAHSARQLSVVDFWGFEAVGLAQERQRLWSRAPSLQRSHRSDGPWRLLRTVLHIGTKMELVISEMWAPFWPREEAVSNIPLMGTFIWDYKQT